MNKILIALLALSVWFQMLAIPIGSFGISISTIIVLAILLFNITTIRLNLVSLLVAFTLIGVMVMVSVINSSLPPLIWSLRICRYTVIIGISLICSWLFKQEQYSEYFWNILSKVTFIGLFYGLYQYFAPDYGLPYFLNIFNNNPSFSAKDIYDYYGGWVNFTRIYGVFSEPSFYGIYLSLFCICLIYSPEYKKLKWLFWALILINLILTFSRSAYFTFGVILMIYFFVEKLKMCSKKYIIYFLSFFLICIPLEMPFAMEYLYSEDYFTDLSMTGRSSSQLYYFHEAVDNEKIVGYGVGSIRYYFREFDTVSEVEGFAHNAVAGLAYEVGLFSLLIYIALMIHLLQMNKKLKYNLILIAGISTSISFGEIYSIESIVILITALFHLRANNFPLQ